MDLILLDIDGTLIQSMADDGDCLVAALEQLFGFTDIDHDWSCYEHVTDAGIFLEAFERRRGHPPSSDETRKFHDHFVALLAERCTRRPLQEVPGAARLLAELIGRSDISVAFATGCFRKTANLKMHSAGLAFDQAPAATCDDAIARDEIMRIAIAKAAAAEGVAGFDNTVYVGDAVWDVLACRRLGLPFIGITADTAAAGLAAEGVELLLPDFLDQALFHEYRQSCAVRRCR